MSDNVVELADRHKAAEGICKTETLLDIAAFISVCMQHSEMGLLIGTPGTGKTTAIRYAQEEMSRNGKPVDELRPFYGSYPKLFAATGTRVNGENHRTFVRYLLAQVVGDYDYKQAHICFEAAAHALRNDAGKSVLVIDEAQKLQEGALEIVREIFDRTNVGVVLIGNDSFSGHFGREADGKYAHIASRITRRFPKIEGVSYEDLSAFCAHHGVTDEHAVEVLSEYANAAGGLRHIEALIKTAKVRAAKKKIPEVSAQLIEDAASSRRIQT